MTTSVRDIPKAGVRLFISYARPDQRRAEQLGAALVTLGYDVWRDSKIRAGHSYDRVIEEAIHAAQLVVVIWSQSSAQSDWVRAEATYALEAGKVLPIRIDDAMLPLRFRQVQTLVFTSWNGDETAPEMIALSTEISERLRASAAGSSPARDTGGIAETHDPSAACDVEIARRGEEARKIAEAREVQDTHAAEEARKAEETQRVEAARLAATTLRSEKIAQTAAETREVGEAEARKAERARKAQEAYQAERARRAAATARSEEIAMAAVRARRAQEAKAMKAEAERQVATALRAEQIAERASSARKAGVEGADTGVYRAPSAGRLTIGAAVIDSSGSRARWNILDARLRSARAFVSRLKSRLLYGFIAGCVSFVAFLIPTFYVIFMLDGYQLATILPHSRASGLDLLVMLLIKGICGAILSSVRLWFYRFPGGYYVGAVVFSLGIFGAAGWFVIDPLLAPMFGQAPLSFASPPIYVASNWIALGAWAWGAAFLLKSPKRYSLIPPLIASLIWLIQINYPGELAGIVGSFSH